jgi:hypothetical protein
MEVVTYRLLQRCPRGKVHGKHWIIPCLGLTAGLDDVGVEKNLHPCWELTPYHPAPNPQLYELSYPGSKEFEGKKD